MPHAAALALCSDLQGHSTRHRGGGSRARTLCRVGIQSRLQSHEKPGEVRSKSQGLSAFSMVSNGCGTKSRKVYTRSGTRFYGVCTDRTRGAVVRTCVSA